MKSPYEAEFKITHRSNSYRNPHGLNSKGHPILVNIFYFSLSIKTLFSRPFIDSLLITHFLINIFHLRGLIYQSVIVFFLFSR